MLRLFKSLVLSRLDYGSQLWSPYKAKDISLLASVQRAFTKHIQGMHTYSYADRLIPYTCLGKISMAQG